MILARAAFSKSREACFSPRIASANWTVNAHGSALIRQGTAFCADNVVKQRTPYEHPSLCTSLITRPHRDSRNAARVPTCIATPCIVTQKQNVARTSYKRRTTRPPSILFEADRQECQFFAGYDPSFDGDEPPDL